MVGVEGEKEIDAYTLEMDYAGFKTFEMIGETLQLWHPVHGLCAQKVISIKNTDYKIRHDWKKKYGYRNYSVCEVRTKEQIIRAEW